MSNTIPNRSVELFNDFASKIICEDISYDDLIKCFRRDVEPPVHQWIIGSISEQANCHIRFSSMAVRDLELSTLIAKLVWDDEICTRFLEFLRTAIINLANREIDANIFDPIPGCEAYFAEFAERSAAYLLVFRRLEDGIAVMFILRITGPRFPHDEGIEAIYRFHVHGPTWAGCDPEGTILRI